MLIFFFPSQDSDPKPTFQIAHPSFGLRPVSSRPVFVLALLLTQLGTQAGRSERKQSPVLTLAKDVVSQPRARAAPLGTSSWS